MADSRTPSEAVLCDGNLCQPFLDRLPISGAAVSLFGGSPSETLVCASGPTAARLDELQFDLGDGPRWEARRTRSPVLVPDIRSSGPVAWPLLSKALLETDVAAMFVFPATLGALDLGIVELHHTRPGALGYSDFTIASVLAGQTAWHLLRSVLSVDQPDSDPSVDRSLLSRREIHQATGMVLAQAKIPAADALLLLRGHAFANSLSLREAAEEVLRGRLSFAPEGDGPDGTALQ